MNPLTFLFTVGLTPSSFITKQIDKRAGQWKIDFQVYFTDLTNKMNERVDQLKEGIAAYREEVTKLQTCVTDLNKNVETLNDKIDKMEKAKK